MKLILALIFLTAPSVRADNFAIINGNKYSLLAEEKSTCGSDINGPEYVANLFLMRAAANIWQDLIPDKKPTTLFSFIRRYPSRFSSPTCESLRNECAKECAKSKATTPEECLIECNQYETWNR